MLTSVVIEMGKKNIGTRSDSARPYANALDGVNSPRKKRALKPTKKQAVSMATQDIVEKELGPETPTKKIKIVNTQITDGCPY